MFDIFEPVLEHIFDDHEFEFLVFGTIDMYP